MYKLGIDVGGTNTDAVLIDKDLKVVAEVKNPTSGDIYDGIVGAIKNVLSVSGVNPAEIPTGHARHNAMHQCQLSSARSLSQ